MFYAGLEKWISDFIFRFSIAIYGPDSEQMMYVVDFSRMFIKPKAKAKSNVFITAGFNLSHNLLGCRATVQNKKNEKKIRQLMNRYVYIDNIRIYAKAQITNRNGIYKHLLANNKFTCKVKCNCNIQRST